MSTVTPPNAPLDAARVLADLRATFATGRTRPVAWRREQLRGLHRLLTARHVELEEALTQDLGKSATEGWLSEIGLLCAEIDHAGKHLADWMRPRRVGVPLVLQPARARVQPEPLGVVLILGPWNYPVQLLLAPLIGALAAGNPAVLKPSESAPATSTVLADLLPRFVDPESVTVVEGGVATATALLAEPFDHIFYTGNGQVGRIVMRAAAEHLTPVTLELGGRSPAFVDAGVDLRATADRLVWGKFLNTGQTCVAPDHVLATPETHRRLVPELRASLRRTYGPDPASSPAYGRIVNDRHFNRLLGLLEGHQPAIGGEYDAASRYLAPTVLTDATGGSPVLAEEIFGPILPLVEVAGPDEAIAQINAGDKPLSVYVFSEDPEVRRAFEQRTSSGALGLGAAPTAHAGVPELPFGGVGGSGIGRYHGRWSFDTFTHPKAVLDKPLVPDTLRALYPPFSAAKDLLIRKVVMPARDRMARPRED